MTFSHSKQFYYDLNLASLKAMLTSYLSSSYDEAYKETYQRSFIDSLDIFD